MEVVVIEVVVIKIFLGIAPATQCQQATRSSIIQKTMGSFHRGDLKVTWPQSPRNRLRT